MAELVHQHRHKGGMVAVHDGKAVVDATPTVHGGIGQYDDMLVRNRSDKVCNVPDIGSGEIAVCVESIEVAGGGRRTPFSLSRNTDPAFGRGSKDGPDGKLVPVGSKGFMREEGIGRPAGIQEELGFIGPGITFRKNHDVNDLPRRILSRYQPGIQPIIGHGADKDIGWIDRMLNTGRYLPVHIRQRYLHFHRMLGERNQKGVFKCLLRMLGLRNDRPLLEKGGETVGIKAFASGGIQDPDLSVSLKQRL